MDWLQVELFTSTQGIEPVCAALMELGISGFSIRDAADFASFLEGKQGHWDYIDEDLMQLQDCETAVTFYLEAGPVGTGQLDQVENALARLKQLDTPREWGRLELETTTVQEESWENSWKQYWHPTPIGERLVVCPTWEPYAPQPEEVVLRLDPGAAFGSGAHQSTRLCLELLQEQLQGGEQVLDLGCGSGILGISALLLGADRNTGIDIDSVAVRVAQENASLNGVEERCIFRTGNLAQGLSEAYDLVFANIVADIILQLAPDLPRLLQPGGILITSGIIDTRSAEVEEALAEQGFSLREKRENGGWVALCYQRPAEG